MNAPHPAALAAATPVTWQASKFLKGYPASDADTQGAELASLLQVLNHRAETDAHVQACVPLNARPGPARRWTKACIGRPELGGGLAIHSLWSDVDAPGHAATPEWQQETFGRLQALLAAHGGCLYQTTNGFRIVHVLPSPFLVTDTASEAAWKEQHAGFRAYLASQFGVQIDAACDDVVRVYRLPKVVRDGVPQMGKIWFAGALHDALPPDADLTWRGALPEPVARPVTACTAITPSTDSPAVEWSALIELIREPLSHYPSGQSPNRNAIGLALSHVAEASGVDRDQFADDVGGIWPEDYPPDTVRSWWQDGSEGYTTRTIFRALWRVKRSSDFDFDMGPIRAMLPGSENFERDEITELSLGTGDRWLSDADAVERLAILELTGRVAEAEAVYAQIKDLGCRVLTSLKRTVAARAKALRRLQATQGLELQTTPFGTVFSNLHNLGVIVRQSPALAGRVIYDDFACEVIFNGQHLKERSLTDIAATIEATHPGMSVDVGKLHAVLKSSAVPHVHPVRDWLSSLTWDRVSRLAQLPDAFGADAKSALYQAVFRKWMISCVARIFEPGCQVDHVLTLKGPQGIGKSTGFRTLVGDEWFSDSPLRLDHPDGMTALAGTWIWEFSELAELSKYDLGRWKGFVTSPSDKVRASYGRVHERRPRQTVFCATVDRDGFLPVGDEARRFWVVEVERPVARDQIAGVRDQLWAEAVAAYREKETWYLDAEQAREASTERTRHQAEDLWTEPLSAWLSGRESCTLREAAEALLISVPVAQDAGVARRLGAVLRQLGWKPTGSARPQRWKHSRGDSR